MKRVSVFIIFLIIIGAVMFATNPTQEDFAKYLENQADRSIKKYAVGTEKIVEDMINSNKKLSGSYSKSGYERTDYYLLSTYESDADVLSYGKKYLGIFKIFIKMD